jgi:hypothetical protein
VTPAQVPNRYQSSRDASPACQNGTIPKPNLPSLRRFLSLDRTFQVLVTETASLSLFIAVAFRLAGVPRTQAWLRSWSGQVAAWPDSRSAIPDCLRAQKMVKRATGLGGMCLARSLTLWALLRRRGVETELRIGYRKRDGKIEGHAWLEHDGAPVNEEAEVLQTYTVAASPVAFDAWRGIRGQPPPD